MDTLCNIIDDGRERKRDRNRERWREIEIEKQRESEREREREREIDVTCQRIDKTRMTIYMKAKFYRKTQTYFARFYNGQWSLLRRLRSLL